MLFQEINTFKKIAKQRHLLHALVFFPFESVQERKENEAMKGMPGGGGDAVRVPRELTARREATKRCTGAPQAQSVYKRVLDPNREAHCPRCTHVTRPQSCGSGTACQRTPSASYMKEGQKQIRRRKEEKNKILNTRSALRSLPALGTGSKEFKGGLSLKGMERC